MPLVKIAEILAKPLYDPVTKEYHGCNLAPLDKTWWHLEWWAISDRTYRFAKRSDHTRILIKLDLDEFYATMFPPDP